MDGNGRWALENGFSYRWDGHRYGVNVARTVVRTAIENNIKVLSLFAFSLENQNRPQSEVDVLIELFKNSIKNELDDLIQNGVRVKFCGDVKSLSDSLYELCQDAEQRSSSGQKLLLNIALNYSGRWHIEHVFKKLLKDQDIKHIDSEMQQLFGSDPDLLIRTSGEYRISNFMLWQIAYTELYFTNAYWPDFTKDEFIKAIRSYHLRNRRFGNVEYA